MAEDGCSSGQKFVIKVGILYSFSGFHFKKNLRDLKEQEDSF